MGFASRRPKLGAPAGASWFSTPTMERPGGKNSDMGIADHKPHLVRVAAPLSGMGSSDPVLGVRRRAYLLPGQLHASAEPCQISTILGSCVSICLFDPTRL